MSAASSRPRYKVARIVAADMPAFRLRDTLRVAGDRMRSFQAEAWPVVEDRTLVGMIDGPNPDWRAQGHGHDPEENFVSGCMHADVPHCHDDDDCDDALNYMIEHHLRFVPVTDREEHYLGMVCLDDLLAVLVGKPAEKKASSR